MIFNIKKSRCVVYIALNKLSCLIKVDYECTNIYLTVKMWKLLDYIMWSGLNLTISLMLVEKKMREKKGWLSLLYHLFQKHPFRTNHIPRCQLPYAYKSIDLVINQYIYIYTFAIKKQIILYYFIA